MGYVMMYLNPQQVSWQCFWFFNVYDIEDIFNTIHENDKVKMKSYVNNYYKKYMWMHLSLRQL